MARPALHDILCGVLGAPFSDGKDHCYFEPPASLEMDYPCIRYLHTNNRNEHADNVKYKTTKRYMVTVIDEDPDSEIPGRLEKLPYSSLDRRYDADGLAHWVYVLYYDGPRINKKEE